MGVYSRKTDIKIGDLVLLQEGIPACVYDISTTGNMVSVNWLGEGHQLHKKLIDVSGLPHSWGMIKVERLLR